MPRTIIDIPSAQMRELDARCQALGISRAEGIRRAVHGFLNVKYGLDQEGFGLWTQAAPDRAAKRASREGKAAREGATRASHGRSREASPRIDGEQAKPAQQGATRASHGRGREASPRVDGEQAKPAQPEKG